MTDQEIEAEVARVSAVVREYLREIEVHAENAGYDDVRVKTWMVGAVVLATDDDGDPREITSAGYETSSRVLQMGMTIRLADLCRHMGEVYQ